MSDNRSNFYLQLLGSNENTWMKIAGFAIILFSFIFFALCCIPL